MVLSSNEGWALGLHVDMDVAERAFRDLSSSLFSSILIIADD